MAQDFIASILPTEFELNEAAEFDMVGDIKFKDTFIGARIIDHLKYLNQLESRRFVMPMGKAIGRKEDMSKNGRLEVFRQDDGDICIAIIDENGNRAGVEFCTRFGGGGKSPRTLKALNNLALAIMEDNLEDPSRQI